MKKQSEKFNIDQYTKDGFDLVIELDDEVEYLVDGEIVVSIKNNEQTVVLKRLIDGKTKIIATVRIIESLQKIGPVDYLKIK